MTTFRMIHLKDPIRVSPLASVLQDLFPIVYEVQAVMLAWSGSTREVRVVASAGPGEESVRDPDLLRRLACEVTRVLGLAA